jgi:hypothetical protein
MRSDAPISVTVLHFISFFHYRLNVHRTILLSPPGDAVASASAPRDAQSLVTLKRNFTIEQFELNSR